MGLPPVLNTVFGLIPIFGHDVWLHALTALIAAYFGFKAPSLADLRAHEREVIAGPRRPWRDRWRDPWRLRRDRW